ncbi:MAG: DegQ family serine endoprotease [Chromatiales bacterium]|nr:DegQ family serine endoprotease [Chromatiales bacterium]
MIRSTSAALLLAGLLSLSAGLPAALPAQVGDQEVPTLAPLIAEVSPTVVSIATRATVTAPANPLMDDPFFRRFFGLPEGQMPERRRQVQSAGSGVIVDAERGYILTNHHVIDRADQIEIVLNDNRRFEATVIGSDPGTDIAVLRVENAPRLTEIRLGDSDQVRVGDFAVAIGNPFGLQHTVTSGIISALGRTGISRDGYEDFIQTDASINPGNSGGALINLRGELIGINSAILSRSGGNIGIGFAIPVNIAKSIMAQIIEFGEVRRGLLGVSISDFTEETARAFGVESVTEGALVQELVAGSPAEKAGIEVGDVIVQVDGQRIRNASELRNSIGLKRSGDRVRIELVRNGQRRRVNATLDQASAPQAEAAVEVPAEEIHPGLSGATLADYTGTGQPYTGQGVIIESVAERSPAGFAGLRANDIIVQVNRVRVRNTEELRAATADQDVLVITARRGTRMIVLQIR